jgi:threonylcarbamoyladenosine tRNA methylthiotransferase MtaB
MKTVKFYTLGCKVNQYDAQAIRESLLGIGYVEASGNKQASACIINTCTVTHRADADSLNLIRRAKRENPAAKIIVTGCLAELDGDKIKSSCSSSIVVKNKQKSGIWRLLSNKEDVLPARGVSGISGFAGHTRAFLKIQDGCNNFCAYCKVPLVRGRSKSKPLKEIVKEASRLVSSGFKEIVLTGICLGVYGKDLIPRVSLADILSVLGKLPGLYRLRLSSIEAMDISRRLLLTISASRVICPHLHIPLQSGDDQILKAMRRSYDSAAYLKLIRKIKTRIPGIGITTDVLVGFPGESAENYKNTLELVKKAAPLKVHIFPYSPREGTAAYRIDEAQIAFPVIRQRMQRLQLEAERLTAAYIRKFLGKRLIVLFEGRCKDSPGYWEGYTANYIKVKVRSRANLANCLAEVTLVRPGVGFAYAEKTKLLTK